MTDTPVGGGSSPPKPTPPDAMVMGVLDRLLAFMTSPWKAAAIIILVMICGALYLLYLERARIADAILTSANTRAELDEKAFLQAGPRLLRDTRADMAMLVSLQLSDNVMTDIIGLDLDGNNWVPTTSPQQALLPESSMPFLVQFLANEVVCLDSNRAVNEDMRVLSAKGYERLCLVAVPPIIGISVGGLMVAWKTPLMPASEQRASYAMKAAAMKFATW